MWQHFYAAFEKKLRSEKRHDVEALYSPAITRYPRTVATMRLETTPQRDRAGAFKTITQEQYLLICILCNAFSKRHWVHWNPILSTGPPCWTIRLERHFSRPCEFGGEHVLAHKVRLSLDETASVLKTRAALFFIILFNSRLDLKLFSLLEPFDLVQEFGTKFAFALQCKLICVHWPGLKNRLGMMTKIL